MQDGFSSRPSARTSLNNVNVFQFLLFLLIFAVGLNYVVSYGHAVVGFEYLGGSEPGVLRVVLGELSLVVIVTHHVLKIEGSSHLSYL